MDRFFIYAKPKLLDVTPYTLGVYNPYLTAVQNFNILVRGQGFYSIRAVYLSASNPSMFDGITFYNPFSANIKLSAQNLSFNALNVPFYIYKEKHLAFQLPQIPKATGRLDIIIENEAGYGLLTRDSRMPFVSSFKGAIDLQLPCVSGLQIIDLVDYYQDYFLLTSDNKFILDSVTDEKIIASYYT